jgi:hypothetical protein
MFGIEPIKNIFMHKKNTIVSKTNSMVSDNKMTFIAFSSTLLNSRRHVLQLQSILRNTDIRCHTLANRMIA